jgi:hypothetical protein
MANGLQSAFYSSHEVSLEKGDAMASRVKAIAEKYKVQEEIKEDEEKPSQLSLVKPGTPNKHSESKKEGKHKAGKGKHEEHEESSGERETSSDSETDEKSDDLEGKKKKRRQKKQEEDGMR